MKWKVINYRYGLPLGSVVSDDKLDEDRKRFLAPIAEAKKKATVKSKKTIGEKQ